MARHQPIRKTTPTPGALASTTCDIPDKLYFRIGEVARLCDVPAYVLRFWESEFPQLKPNKGGTGQRLFRRRDVEMALRIKRLLYDEGYTIPGARQLLRADAKLKEPQLLLLEEDAVRSQDRESQLCGLRQELAGLLRLLEAAPGTAAVDPAASFPVRAAARQRHSTSRRSAVISQPASEKLFDFPGGATAPADRQSNSEGAHDE